MEFSKVLVILLCIIELLLWIVYMTLGRIVLHSIKYRDRELERWIYTAPSIIILNIALLLWPIIVIYYYVQPRRD